MILWDVLPYGSALIAVLAVLSFRASWKRARRASRWRAWGWLGVSLFHLGLFPIAVTLTVATFWYTHRTQPEPDTVALFQGVEYIREIRAEPRDLVIHVVKIDLQAEGIRFLVTPDDRSSERTLKARKTTDFLQEFGLQLAINANYFYPFASNSPWDYYPRTGDPVDLCGIAASRGKVYSSQPWKDSTLYLTARNDASFERPAAPIECAISGNGFLVRHGRATGPFEDSDLYPRAALALDSVARFLILVVVDGKQPHYSEGCTLDELARIIQDHGGHDAIRLDEGGSATLAAAGRDGRATLLNCPINSRIPGFERPVANHLGLYARP